MANTFGYPRVEKYLRKYGRFIIRQARKIIKKKGKVDSGKLLRSLKYRLTQKKGIFDIEFKSARHGDFIDKGVQGAPGILDGIDSTAGQHGGAKLRPNRTYIDAATGKRKRSPYKFKTPNIRSSIMESYVQRQGIKIGDMSVKSMAFIVGRAIKAKGIQGISFYSQPISAFSRKFREEIMEEFETDVLNLITQRKRKSGNR